MIDLRFRPYQTWPDKSTVGRKNGTFRVTYATMLGDLETELSHLCAKDITISTGHKPEEIRNDGWPRATAKSPAHPGVILYCQTKHGALSFQCDTYAEWKDNLRAISLTLSNLRSIDRYGAVKRGQQYKGFAQLPAGPAATVTTKFTDPLDIAAVRILRAGGYEVTSESVKTMRTDPGQLRSIFGAAVLKAHPDQGGKTEEFIAVRAAFETLKKGMAG